MQNNVSFTSRCPQIRDAQWVCHKVNTEYPHISSTKFAASAFKYMVRYSQNTPTTKTSFLKKSQLKQDKATAMLLWRAKCIQGINRARKVWRSNLKNNYDRIDSTFMQLELDKKGNCGEDAMLSLAILKMNGKPNAYLANLKSDIQNLDHCVCIFNKDGKPFDGRIDRNTIVIDSWLGVVDFAGNMLKKYKNIFNEKLGLKANGNLKFGDVEDVKLTKKHIDYLREDYPQFISPKNFV